MFRLLIGVFLPFFGTCLGAFLVFFFIGEISSKLNKILLGFSAGVMMASSVWSLIIPSIKHSEFMGNWSFFPAFCGICFGLIFMVLLDKFCLKISSRAVNLNGSLKGKTRLLFWAVTIHNIPEGMAVGVAFASAFLDSSEIAIASAFAVSIGIAIQNIPEGAIVSLPLRSENISKKKSFCFGVCSGVVEPIFASITILMTKFIAPALPYLLSFAAGAMIFVSVGELIPESNDDENSKLGTVSFVAGFLLMMILDVALG